MSRKKILRGFARFILFLTGWKVKGSLPPDVKKCVIAVVGHTSYWDAAVGRLGLWALGIKCTILVKKEAFTPALGWLLRINGGVPVNRSNSTGLVTQVVQMVQKADEFFLVIAPEGTRSRVSNWKKGYYFIAQAANIPIAVGFVDYKKKEGGIGPLFYPTGNYEEDFKIIREFAKDITPRFPELFVLPDEEEKK
ncbi:MAG: 1-acyl-sn-glycerol-3-phosphate acyltransferase [Bacteroidota bacterium]